MQKVQRIYIQTSPLRFKRCKGFTHKVVVVDSKSAKDLYTNQSLKIQKVQRIHIQTTSLRFKWSKGFTYNLVVQY